MRLRRPEIIFLYWVAITFLIRLALGGYPLDSLWYNNLRNISILNAGFLLVLLAIPKTRRGVLELFDPQYETVAKKITLGINVYFFLYFLKATLFNYFAFENHLFDFSNLDYLIPNTAEGHFMKAFQNFNHMSTHASWIFMPLYPIHRLFNSPLFFVTLSGVLVWSGGPLIARLGHALKIKKQYTLIIVTSYFLFTYVQRVVMYQFHFEEFYIPLFLGVILAFVEKKWILFWILFTLGLSVKEDGALYLIAILASLSWSFRRNWLVAGMGSVICVAVFVLNIKVAMPYFSDKGTHELVKSAAGWGGSLTETFRNLLSSWWQIPKIFLTGNWLKSSAYFLFSIWITPFYWIASFPFNFIHSISKDGQMHDWLLYYSAPILPILFASWLFAVKKKAHPVILLLIFVVMSVGGAGYLTTKRPHPYYAEFRYLRAKIDFGRPVCTQGVVIPNLPYANNLHILPESICKDFKADYYLMGLDLFEDEVTSHDIAARLKSNPAYTMSEKGPFVLFERK